ncbi:MAG: hypothetical protein EB117_18480, partial [Betaproteobacteria bacterium]|nr:hypothetical protein [Betaproteobacteria bacterium]
MIFWFSWISITFQFSFDVCFGFPFAALAYQAQPLLGLTSALAYVVQHESTANALRICFVHRGQVLQPVLAFFVEYLVLHFLQVYGWHDLLRRRFKLVAAAWTLFERIMTKILA